MIFSTHVFLVWFFPIVLLGYYVTPAKWRSVWLTLVSYVFYGWFKAEYCALLAFVTLFSYAIGVQVKNASGPIASKRWLVLGVGLNLSLLGFFKYAGMLAVWTISASELFEFQDSLSPALSPFLRIALPIGISFFVFQAISYLVDVYRGDAPPSENFIDFASYISMFPQLIAGPIVRYEWVAGQLRHRTHTVYKVILGVRFFALGLAKKVLIADVFALAVPVAFGPHQPGLSEAWIGVIAYTLQIYFDFSAYSDMAVGLGLMMGFHFPQNFDSPYKSASITEFWRRWHISLSSFLRDYLYIPLGGNRRGQARTYLNLVAVMGLGGLWHGASILFVVWGLWHGALLAIERYLGDRHPISRLPRAAAVLVTTLLAMIGWIPFRAEDLGMALRVFEGMTGLAGAGNSEAPIVADALPWALLPGLVCCWVARNTWEMSSEVGIGLAIRDAVILGVALAAVFATNSSPFLYFQF